MINTYSVRSNKSHIIAKITINKWNDDNRNN